MRGRLTFFVEVQGWDVQHSGTRFESEESNDQIGRVLQALGARFEILSASDICASYRDFCRLNYVGKFHHIYTSLQEQVASNVVCESCQGTLAAASFGPCKAWQSLPADRSIDLLFTGSPCDPFSTARAKRFSSGDPTQHAQFDVTMQQVLNLYQLYEPEKGIFEQVPGFNMPFVAGGQETPKQRLGLRGKPCTSRLYSRAISSWPGWVLH